MFGISDFIIHGIYCLPFYYDDKRIWDALAQNDGKYLYFHDELSSYGIKVTLPLLLLSLIVPIILSNMNFSIKLLLILILLSLIAFIVFPIIRRRLAYQRFCWLFVMSKDIKSDLETLNKIILETAKQKSLNTDDIKAIISDNTIFKQELITSNSLKIREKIWSWIEKNTSKFDIQFKKELDKIHHNDQSSLNHYLNEVLFFCHNYQKNITSGIYKEDLIPPMPFSDNDITYFENLKNKMTKISSDILC